MSNNMTPFLKWAGGKRWFVHKHIDIIPRDFNCYYEPFVGSGAVFFALSPKTAVISDINDELINLFVIMRDHPDELKYHMLEHQHNHSKDYYYYIRSSNFPDNIRKAARTLYLNRTCFNGLYRVNKNGQFNVPIGTKKNCIYDIQKFDCYSKLLKNAIIRKEDFRTSIARAKEGDLVFADPPYVSAKNEKGFIKYNEKLFTWNDQIDLMKILIKAREYGVKIMSTNTNSKELKEMYLQNHFNVYELERNSTVAGNLANRKSVKEILIIS